MCDRSPRWTRRPEHATWGDFGPDDQLGRLNLLTADKVRQGVAEVVEGQTFCLSLPLDLPGGSALNPRRPPPRLKATRRDGAPNMVYPLSRDTPGLTDIICDDIIEMPLQYSTQWDSLAHMGQWFDADGDGESEMCFYNGYRGGDDIRGAVDYRDPDMPHVPENECGAHALSIANMAEHGIQGRGVMIDIVSHLGPGCHVIGFDALETILRAEAIEIETGDMICFRFGMDQAIIDMAGAPDADWLKAHYGGLDGRDGRLREWIADSGVAALIADNPAVEIIPADTPSHTPHASHPLHDLCLFRLGLPLGELWRLSPLADWLASRSRHRFLLTAPPLNLPRAVGSPVTPIATV